MKRTLSHTERRRLLRRYLKLLEENVVLADHFHFRVGGVADYFVRATTLDHLILAYSSAIFVGLPVTVIGDGSHSLVSDTGFPGLVIKNEVREIVSDPETGLIVAGSGVRLQELITKAAAVGLSGVESFAGRLGTIGGALARPEAYDRLSPLVQELSLVRVKKPRFQRSEPLEMVEILTLPIGKFSPRLASPSEGPMILTAKLKLRQLRPEATRRALSDALRRAQQEVSFRLVNQGEIAGRLGRPSITAAELLRSVRLNGWSEGGVRLVDGRLCPAGRSTAEAIRRLAETAKVAARERYGAILEETFTYIGRW